MMTIDVINNRPRIQRFWIKCPAPGMSQPTAGATTDIVLGDVAGRFFATTGSFRVGVVAIFRFRAGRNSRPLASLDSDEYEFTLHSTSYFSALAAHQHVDLAAYAELWEICSRLNRKQAVRQNTT